MERSSGKTQYRLSVLFLLIAVTVAIWLAYVNNFTGEGMTRGSILLILTIGVVVILILMPHHDAQSMLSLLLLAGIGMRILYTVYTPYSVRGHDLGQVSLEGNGHAAYLLHLLENGSLPDNNQGQFYHPPLFHFLAAVVVKLFSYVRKDDSVITLLQFARIVPCYASCMTLVFVKRITDELKLSDRVKWIALSVVAFLPSLWLLAATVNNDSLALCFMMWIVLCYIRWYQRERMADLAGMALGFGFGIMTKINVGMLAIPIGVAMAAALVLKKDGRTAVRIRQYLVFLLISVPLGLWYPIRNWIRFGQPLLYVLDLKDMSMPSLADISLWKRILPWGVQNWFEPVFANVYQNYNMPEYLLKSAVFGEFTFEHMGVWAVVLLLLQLLVTLVSFTAVIYLAVCCRRQRKHLSLGIVSVYVIWILSYMCFNIRYPFGCSMDFRYVAMTGVAGALALAVLTDELWEKGGRYKKGAFAICGLTVCYSVCAIICYCVP